MTRATNAHPSLVRRSLALGILSLALFVARAANAQDATEWKKRGDDAMDAGRAAEALEAYRHAQAIAPSPALDYNVGRALLAIGDFVAALEAFEKFERDAPEELRQRTYRLSEIMKELRGKIAMLTITGAPQGARVFVRGAPVRDASGAFRVNPGTAEVRVEADDHAPFAVTIDLAPGALGTIAAELRPLPKTGTLMIVVRPQGASVTIDGVPRGSAPSSVELTPGDHSVTLEAKGHRASKSTVTVERGRSRRIDFELEGERPPLTSRWWFWGALGAVAAGATIAIIAGTSERAPEDGSLGTFHVP